MPNVTISVEESSPLLIYSDGWVAGNSNSDRALDHYSQSGYMGTDKGGSSVTFVFTGTEISFWGAKRPRYGQYEIKVNDERYAPRNASSNEEFFQAVLFNASWPAVKSRSVTMTNLGANSGLDVDFVSWTFPVGNPDEEVIVNTFQSSDPSFSYSPQSAWATNPANASRFVGGTGHVTYNAGSSFKFTFEGDAVALFGPVGPTGVPYTVSVDTNNLPDDFTTQWPAFQPNTMLYHRANLGSGRHTLSLDVADVFEANGLESSFVLGYAQVYTAPSLRGTTGPAAGRSGTLTPGAAAGISVGVLLGILALLLAIGWVLILYIARKRDVVFRFGFIPKTETVGSAAGHQTVQPFYMNVAPGSPPMTAAAERLLQHQTSNNSLPQTPMSSLSTRWSSAGAHSVVAAAGVYDPISQATPPGGNNAQEVIIPSRGFEKIRREQTPQMQPPPLGSRSRQLPATATPFTPIAEESHPSSSEYGFSSAVIPPPMYTYNDPSTAATKSFP